MGSHHMLMLSVLRQLIKATGTTTTAMTLSQDRWRETVLRNEPTILSLRQKHPAELSHFSVRHLGFKVTTSFASAAAAKHHHFSSNYRYGVSS